MTTTAFPGPLSIEGQKPALLGTAGYTGAQPALLDSNPDLAPSLVWGGIGIRDPRFRQIIGEGSLGAGGYPNQDVGWYMSAGGLILCDAVPQALATNNIAANQTLTSGTAMALAAASTGITVLAAALALPLPLGATIPSGALVLDGNPGYTGGGSSGAFKFLDPTKALARAVSITAAAGATGGAITVRGYDVYGQPVSETITAVAASTVNGKKALKFVVSATPAFTDGAHNYSIGTTDIFGFGAYVESFPYSRIFWNDAQISANTGFVAGVTTTPSATTGDPRGTYATQSASDGAKKLVLFAMPSVAAIVASTFAAAQNGLVGKTQFSN